MAETLPSPEPGSTVADLLLALDQGTQSSRCVLFDRSGRQLVARSVEFPQLRPRPGWCEHCPAALVASTLQAAAACLGAAEVAWGPAVSRRRGTDGLWTDGDNNKCRWRVACVGVANQRETCLAWDRASGEPLGPCVVWHDARPADDGTIDAARTALAREGVPDDAALRAATGLPLSPYFSGPKLAWLSEHCPRVRAAFESDAARVGTVDTLLAHWLTGGPERADAAHVTDLTNGARTLLLDLGAGPGGDGWAAVRFRWVDATGSPRAGAGAAACAWAGATAAALAAWAALRSGPPPRGRRAREERWRRRDRGGGRRGHDDDDDDDDDDDGGEGASSDDAGPREDGPRRRGGGRSAGGERA